MSDPSKLDEYCERIINEYKDFPPIDYQLGYPLNYKDQVKNAEVRYEIDQSINQSISPLLRVGICRMNENWLCFCAIAFCIE